MKLSTLKFVVGMALVLTAVAAPVFAQSTNPDFGVPEIGIGSIGSAMTLLSGGYLVLTSSLRRKK